MTLVLSSQFQIALTGPYSIDMTESKSACTCLLRLKLPAYVLVAFAILTGFDSAAAQNAGWTALTSFREVRAIDGLNRQIWVATTGGVFSYDTESGELNQLTVVDGLHSVEAAAITIDEKRGLVWVGYSDGALDRIDLGSRRDYVQGYRARQTVLLTRDQSNRAAWGLAPHRYGFRDRRVRPASLGGARFIQPFRRQSTSDAGF